MKSIPFVEQARVALLAVAVFVAAEFLIFLPIFMAGSVESTKFYGAFFGSLVSALAAVVAVIVGTRSTAKFAELREEKNARARRTAVARVAAAELASMAATIHATKLSWDAPFDEKKDMNPQLVSKLQILQVSWRELVVSPIIDQNLVELCSLGDRIAVPLLEFLRRRGQVTSILRAAEPGLDGDKPKPAYGVTTQQQVSTLLGQLREWAVRAHVGITDNVGEPPSDEADNARFKELEKNRLARWDEAFSKIKP